jgi:hypothetical protein
MKNALGVRGQQRFHLTHVGHKHDQATFASVRSRRNPLPLTLYAGV